MATPPLNQDQKLIQRARLELVRAPKGEARLPEMVLSVRFSLARSASNMANELFVRLKQEEHFVRHYYVHNPNVLRKGFCGLSYSPVPKFPSEKPDIDDDAAGRKIYGWARNDDPDWKCSGLCQVSCWKKIRDASHNCERDHGDDLQKNGCWRFLYRKHLQRAKDMGGCMIQLQEGNLGRGQEVELKMAHEVGVKVVVIRCSEIPFDVIKHLRAVIDGGKEIDYHVYQHRF